MRAWRPVILTIKIALCQLFVSFLVIGSGTAYAQVTLADNGMTVTLANGTVTATIRKNNGQITSMKLGALETVSGNVYYFNERAQMAREDRWRNEVTRPRRS